MTESQFHQIVKECVRKIIDEETGDLEQRKRNLAQNMKDIDWTETGRKLYPNDKDDERRVAAERSESQWNLHGVKHGTERNRNLTPKEVEQAYSMLKGVN